MAIRRDIKSYEKIDYRIRVRKFIERRMILDSCQRLFHFGNLDEYRYIGFGSLHFVDFKLFHKQLGLRDMISIEDQTDKGIQYRFEFNKPYRFVKINFNKSTKALREIEFDKKSIVWLDYDENLSGYMFEDIEILIDKMKSGSLFIISLNTSINGEKTNSLVVELKKAKERISQLLVNLAKEDGLVNLDTIGYIKKMSEAINQLNENYESGNINKEQLAVLEKHLNEYNKKIEEANYDNSNKDELIRIINYIFQLLDNASNYREKSYRLEKFSSEFLDYIPNRTIKENELTEKQSHFIIKEMLDLQIKKQIELINIGKDDNDKITYRQLYYFTYKDNARMMTIGGIIYKKSEGDLYDSCCFNELDFIRDHNKNYEIEVPTLTLKEMQNLDNTCMAIGEISCSVQDQYNDVLGEDKKLYYSLYRYLPNFINVDQI